MSISIEIHESVLFALVLMSGLCTVAYIVFKDASKYGFGTKGRTRR